MALCTLDLRPFAFEPSDVSENALLAEGMTTIHQGMRKSEQTFAKRASEHIRHLLSSGTPLGSLGFTICLST